MATKDSTRQLKFTAEAKELLTPFRKNALERLHETGCRELGRTLKSTRVSAYSDYDNPDPTILMLTFVADVDKHEWIRAHKAITRVEVEEASSWTDDERADSAKMIFFQIIPLKI